MFAYFLICSRIMCQVISIAWALCLNFLLFSLDNQDNPVWGKWAKGNSFLFWVESQRSEVFVHLSLCECVHVHRMCTFKMQFLPC